MKQQWQDTSDKFLQLTSREQSLVLITGLVAIFFIISYLFIDDKSAKIISFDKQSRAMKSGNQTLTFTINEYQKALKQDPDKDTVKQIAQFEAKLAKIDGKLVHLTTDLISPSEMREALLKLLKLEPGVTLQSFELVGAIPLLDLNTKKEGLSANEQPSPSAEQLGLNLYKHGIKLRLSGKYFQLRNYLRHLEKSTWKFFWQDFQFEVVEYPRSEVEITIYSLGLNKEFIGV
jgi:MSHA biogenesis protein MshJ